MSADELAALAAEAFIYGFPLVFGMSEIEQVSANGLGSVPATGFNRFSHAHQLAGPADKFVSINNDTVYSLAMCDLSGGPLRLSVPDAGDRYYVLQFVDAWTNNFAYVGHRATGTGAATFLLVPPGSDATPHHGEGVIHCPTTIFAIVGRWAVHGANDIAAAASLQAGLGLEAVGDAPSNGVAQPDPRVDDDLRFFEQLRTWIREFPPAERDLPVQARFAPLGLFDAESPYVDPDPTLAEALRQGAAKGHEALEQALKSAPTPKQNGWQLTYHVFDYNLDFFEVGAKDDKQWKLGTDARTRYVVRALAARAGLWGNHGYEAAYAIIYDDADGHKLNGAGRYRLRFATTPPVGAFWSVTMYDVPDFFLVDNPISRYSIGDRTEGLSPGADGSVTIYLQHERPQDPAEAANWLPAPAGDFRPILRMYEPGGGVFDGSYELPPIERVAGP